MLHIGVLENSGHRIHLRIYFLSHLTSPHPTSPHLTSLFLTNGLLYFFLISDSDWIFPDTLTALLPLSGPHYPPSLKSNSSGGRFLCEPALAHSFQDQIRYCLRLKSALVCLHYMPSELSMASVWGRASCEISQSSAKCILTVV